MLAPKMHIGGKSALSRWAKGRDQDQGSHTLYKRARVMQPDPNDLASLAKPWSWLFSLLRAHAGVFDVGEIVEPILS